MFLSCHISSALSPPAACGYTNIFNRMFSVLWEVLLDGTKVSNHFSGCTAGFLGVRRKECSSSRLSSGPLLPPSSHAGVGQSGAHGGREEHREFSGLLLSVLLSLHRFCRESSGSESQTPLLPLHRDRESQTLPRPRGSILLPSSVLLLLLSKH